jgi:hypothetical protein
MFDQAHNLRCLAKGSGAISWKNPNSLNLGARLADIGRRVWARTNVLIWRKRTKFNVRLVEAIAKPEEKDF